MKDLLGQDLQIGDRVVTTTSHYETLSVGYIDSFTPKGARVIISAGINYRWTRVKFSNQLVRVEECYGNGETNKVEG